MDIVFVGFVTAVFVAAGLVKGVLGMGLPTMAIGLLALQLPPTRAAALLIIPSLVTNLWQLLAGPAFAGLMRRFRLMMIGVIIGTIATSHLLSNGDSRWPLALLGSALILYAALGLASIRFPSPGHHERWLSPLIGIATGAVTGATGVFVIPAVPYLQTLGLKKDELVQALGLSFTISTVALGLALGAEKVIDSSVLLYSTLLVALALLGMFFGQAVRKVLSEAHFRRWFLSGLIFIGANILLTAVKGPPGS